jgi:mRNA interferase MazF
VARTDTGETHRLLWVLMITSAANRSWPGDVPISNERAVGLPAPSVIRCAKIATIAPIEAGDAERLGTLPRAVRTKVAAELKRTLAISGRSA